MLINLSNHPLKKWSEKQKRAAERQFGVVVDVPFPNVPTSASLQEIIQLADTYVGDCLSILNTPHDKSERHAVHVMGEMTFVYQFVHKMTEQGVLCVASTSERKSMDLQDGKMVKVFEFIQFRPYASDLS